MTCALWACARPSAISVARRSASLIGRGVPLDVLAQRLPLDQLHGDEDDAIHLVDLVDGCDIGVVDGGRRAGLTHEAKTPLLVGNQVRGQHLQRHLTLQLRVLGAVDDPHAALADPVEDFEVR